MARSTRHPAGGRSAARSKRARPSWSEAVPTGPRASKTAERPAPRRAPKLPRVLVIYKKSTYQLWVSERKNPHARALLERKDRAVERMLAAHEDHVHTIQAARELLERLGVDASFRYRAGDDCAEGYDLVITLGGDGTLLRASHLVGSQPMLAINTAPQDSIGYFCGGTKDTLEESLSAAIRGELPARELTRMQIALDDELLSRRVLNDVLFCHEVPAATTRYLIRYGRLEEDQRSSGVWVGPAAGSTAAQRSAGGKVLPLDSSMMQFVVREPYMPNGTRYKLVQGLFGPREALTITSKIHGGRLYVDGPHLKRKVDLGSVIRLERSPESLTVLGFRARGRGSR
jgi:NAD+ kinase